MKHYSLTSRYALLSIGAAVVVIILKTTAYQLTDSVGLLSDALESLVNLFAAIAVLVAVIVAARPPDDEHSFGHHKAEYFSSGVEGTLILVTALMILMSAVSRLQSPQSLMRLDIGVGLTAIAAVLNYVVAQILKQAAKNNRSIALEADAQHLLSDVWTSVGVIAGIALMRVTGWLWLDAAIALGVAAHILFVGWRLVRKSILGLMDSAWPDDEKRLLDAILEEFCVAEVTFHALRTRISGSLRFVSMHLQVPGDWSVQEGHILMEKLEAEIRQQLSPVSIIIHLEPTEDPTSWHDIELTRSTPAPVLPPNSL